MLARFLTTNSQYLSHNYDDDKGICLINFRSLNIHLTYCFEPSKINKEALKISMDFTI
jgi:hypothetical protein